MADHTERFGKTLRLEDAAGNVAEQAFAALSTLFIDVEEGVIRIEKRAWRDTDAYDGGKAPLKLTPGSDTKSYYLNGDRYREAIAMLFDGVPAAKIITDLVWQVVEAVNDVEVEPPSEEHPEGVYRSFFEGAVNADARPGPSPANAP